MARAEIEGTPIVESASTLSLGRPLRRQAAAKRRSLAGTAAVAPSSSRPPANLSESQQMLVDAVRYDEAEAEQRRKRAAAFEQIERDVGDVSAMFQEVRDMVNGIFVSSLGFVRVYVRFPFFNS